MPNTREDCWMTFTEALEQYLKARESKVGAPKGCPRYERAVEDMAEAAQHMVLLTGDK